MKKITDKKIKDIFKSIRNNEENAMMNYSIALLSIMSEIRDIVSKYEKICDCSNLKTDPTKLKKNDILIGEIK